ncbi:MAG: peptide deformylase, partial [Tissierellia bacterium]|nr:peptide deformylase [Tissierellia bacterium]
MVETMYELEGVGLAAPQVGILRRAVVIDIGDGPIKMVNPVILERDGKIVDVEGCLSVPGKSGIVERPETLKAEYTDENSERIQIEAEGFLARAICHELDHLDGVLYTDLALKIADVGEITEEDIEEFTEV